MLSRDSVPIIVRNAEEIGGVGHSIFFRIIMFISNGLIIVMLRRERYDESRFVLTEGARQLPRIQERLYAWLLVNYQSP